MGLRWLDTHVEHMARGGEPNDCMAEGQIVLSECDGHLSESVQILSEPLSFRVQTGPQFLYYSGNASFANARLASDLVI